MIVVEFAKHLRLQPDVAHLLVADDTTVKVFLGAVPQGVDFPAVTVIGIGGGPDYHLRGEIADLQKIVQVSVFAPTYQECQAISDAIRLAVSGYRGQFDETDILAVVVQNERDATIAPADSGNRAGWTQSVDYRVTFRRGVAQETS